MTAAEFALVWYRNDLRTYDHLPLVSACQSGLPVLALFIATPGSWQQHHMAPIKQDLIRRRVRALEQELSELNIPLLAVEAEDYQSCLAVLAALIQAGAQALYAETEYELREQQRDAKATALFQNSGKAVYFSDRRALMPPGSVLNKSSEMYQVFTPFKKAWLQQLAGRGVQVHKRPAPQLVAPVLTLDMPAMQPGDQSSLAYEVGEQQVLEQMRRYCQVQVQDYQQKRDFPALDATSGLSAYLAIGVISVHQAVARLQLEHGQTLNQGDSGPAVWLSELIWRDFYIHILVAFPQLIKHKAFQAETDQIVWPNDPQLFQAWCDGKTGYPIVDAAMRQLNQTGWMHNRLRMIVASFLVKDLHIDWRWGERYFMSKLIDGDFAANNGGWQWAASTGTDAAPYFRIFNPVTQSERFDPKGDFIRRMVPELADLPAAQIHWPHPLPMWSDYVAPVVDHSQARLITLQLFKAVKHS
ncbi:deoxyribodipyrimidine photo-lyase [Rheinheimera marina]|uniref:Deoxyribodipyrimidine photo-lyase n=1 Tax=Rheinheimera marina TaxID=1774958 RepID=A0ABV9JR68_9GAMM